MIKGVIIFIIFCLVLSCSKEKEAVVPVPSLSFNFTPMSVGNYWVYGHYNIDTLGQETQMAPVDSVSITKEITLRGNKYFVFEGTNYPYGAQGVIKVLKVIRDSSDYIVDTSGRIIFAKFDFSDSLHVNYEIISSTDTFHSDVFKMKIATKPIQVPAGAFKSVMIYHGLHYMHRFKLPPYVPNPRNYDFYYANGVGLIVDTYFYSRQAGYGERRLLRYHIQ